MDENKYSELAFLQDKTGYSQDFGFNVRWFSTQCRKRHLVTASTAGLTHLVNLQSNLSYTLGTNSVRILFFRLLILAVFHYAVTSMWLAVHYLVESSLYTVSGKLIKLILKHRIRHMAFNQTSFLWPHSSILTKYLAQRERALQFVILKSGHGYTATDGWDVCKTYSAIFHT